MVKSCPQATWQAPRSVGGFTLVELLVALVTAAAFFTAAALIFQSVSQGQHRLTSFGEITIGQVFETNFYGNETADGVINAYWAPNYGRSALVEQLRDQLHLDLQSASGVYGLTRSGVNSLRPQSVSLGSVLSPAQIATPNAFRDLLAIDDSSAYTIFGTFDGFPGTKNQQGENQNATFFLTTPGDSMGAVDLLAVYEIDLVEAATPVGLYASVRRYAYDDADVEQLTHYYDIFYEGATRDDMGPIFVHIENENRDNGLAAEETNRFRQAKGASYYIIWFPDPVIPVTDVIVPSTSSNDPNSSYAAQGVRTAHMQVVPMFPMLTPAL
ncbi:MAG: prepilin-type N-terminal cleavage/methylation domain-containing protein [Verrucomicrobiota bacterium]